MADKRLAGLRANALAALVMLVVEYGLGMAVNLGVTVPASDRNLGLLPALGAAMASGPPALAVHAILGLVLLAAAAAFLLRALAARRPAAIAAGAVGMLALLAAAGSGARFVASGLAAASMSMAVASGVAMLAYAVILFRLGGTRA